MQPPLFIEKFYIIEQKDLVFGILILNNALHRDAATHTSEILQLQVKLSLCYPSSFATKCRNYTELISGDPTKGGPQ